MVQLMVDGAIPSLVVLGSRIKQIEQAMMHLSSCLHIPALFEFLSWYASMMSSDVKV